MRPPRLRHRRTGLAEGDRLKNVRSIHELHLLISHETPRLQQHRPVWFNRHGVLAGLDAPPPQARAASLVDFHGDKVMSMHTRNRNTNVPRNPYDQRLAQWTISPAGIDPIVMWTEGERLRHQWTCTNRAMAPPDRRRSTVPESTAELSATSLRPVS